MNRTLFAVSLRQAASPGRLLLLLLFATLPLGVGTFVRVVAPDEDLMGTVLDPLVIATFIPLAVMAVATAAFGNEVEDRTLGLLALKPISRMSIVFAKLTATLALTAPLAIGVAMVVGALGGGDSPGPAALAAGAGAALGTTAYASIFVWAGLVSTRAIGFALIYVLLWEALMASLMEGIRYLSVRSYTIGIMHGLEGEAFDALADRAIELPAALAGVIIATVVFNYLSFRRLSSMDIP